MRAAAKHRPTRRRAPRRRHRAPCRFRPQPRGSRTKRRRVSAAVRFHAPVRPRGPLVSNIFDDDPPGGLWDDELDPDPSATPHLRSVRQNPERPPPGSPPDRRDGENAALIDLTQRRAPRRPMGEQDEKHHGPTTRRYALLGALGTVAIVAAVAVTALGGHPAQRRAPVAGAALQTDTERPAATRKVQQASAAAPGRSPAHQRVKAHGARTQRSTRSRKRGDASKPANHRSATSTQAATQTTTAIAQRTPQSTNQPPGRAPSTPTRSATSASAARASAANSEFSIER
jgi:hypothetical protein